ncbi:ribose-5-phosphate isomerase RpiA [Weissella ceti]|uniref:Ribose-5-phosphate isomerase A n=1 Tax=Weissella ceti TaxID=759620 RepID=A0ABT3E569_9LACO|nr:ribose-5-phosphate isomerase RpiA [Weissella ceti]MCW0953379.1 ribose-5-phosphate isomerase RpiA [Weissella ceti]QVK11983.1 ribose-5-phosphate isomerase RpiA [Weissella ceti]
MTNLEVLDAQKKKAAQKAASLMPNNAVIGLGTGSTAAHFVRALAERVKNEGLQIEAVSTSFRTADLATELGIKVLDIDEVKHVDVTVDGADEVDPALNGIKGGGAALLFEKVVAMMSDKNIWIVDSSKYHTELGSFLLPIEVVKFGSQQVFNFLAEKGLQPQWRMTDADEKLATDSENYIIDVQLPAGTDVLALGTELKAMTGVVEHGLFLEICDMLIIGGEEMEIIER